MSKVDRLVSNISREILNPLILLLASAALLYFLWGVVMFIANADDESARAKGRQHIIWGILGLVVMMGVYGILGFVTDLIGAPNPY